jgi:hypothetical protein
MSCGSDRTQRFVLLTSHLVDHLPKDTHYSQMLFLTFRGSRKANDLLSCHLATPILATPVLATPLKPMLASTSYTEGKAISGYSVSFDI